MFVIRLDHSFHGFVCERLMFADYMCRIQILGKKKKNDGFFPFPGLSLSAPSLGTFILGSRVLGQILGDWQHWLCFSEQRLLALSEFSRQNVVNTKKGGKSQCSSLEQKRANSRLFAFVRANSAKSFLVKML